MENIYSFNKDEITDAICIYTFDANKYKNVVSFFKNNNFLGSNSGVTHEISWGILDNKINYNIDIQGGDYYNCKNTVFSIIDDYILNYSSSTKTNYIRVHFSINGDVDLQKTKISQKELQEKYGKDNVQNINDILFVAF
jgi:hypothetical protein